MDSASDNLTLGGICFDVSVRTRSIPPTKYYGNFMPFLMFAACIHLYCFHSQGKAL